ncbi:MAG: MFS transporter [Candidatus Omnitrophica bacterium]|nr:MFS transporter [Candidatus Omnitrophota bacterium]
MRCLRNRNYRLLFFGNGLSLVGTWMQTVTVGWLVYKLSHSSYTLGVTGAFGTLPVLLFSLFGGYIADRINRYKIVLVTQFFAMIQAFIMALLTLSGNIRVTHIMILSFVLGAINAFDIPARQSFIVNIVEKKEDLSNAISLNSLLVNGARLIGPSIAGILVASFGEGICFLLNAVSYIAVILALLMMDVKKINPVVDSNNKGKVFEKLHEGFKYVIGFVPVRLVILYIAFFSIFGMFYGVLMPVFAKDVFSGTARTLGFLVGSGGFGAIIGAIYLASRRKHTGLGKTIHFAGVIFGLSLILFSSCSAFWLAAAILVIVGATMVLQIITGNIILQTLVSDEKRGRTMSFHTLAFMGTQPVSSYLAGLAGKSIGIQNTVLLSGILCIIGSMIFKKKYLSFVSKNNSNDIVSRIFAG